MTTISVRFPPKRIYVERWPEKANRDDSIHYMATGYGVDMATGATSTIYEYVRVPRPKKRKAKR